MSLLCSIGCSSGRDDGLALAAQTFDAEFHHIAGFQPHLRSQPHADSGGRAGVDQVTRFQHEVLTQIVNDEIGIEDHG
jgi:hypothetical protein